MLSETAEFIHYAILGAFDNEMQVVM